MFASVLVANRGEIAVRVIRTLRALGIRAIAVYSDADRDAPHVRLADASVRLGPAPATDSYLSIDAVLAAARTSGAEAIHPGYGFLSENPAFARACRDAGIVFVGPPPEAMELLGDKVRAKLAAEQAGVPVVPGLQRPGLSDEEIAAFAAQPDRLPLMVKAAAGGGGRGMRVVHTADELPDALAAARREALAGFGDDGLFVERYVQRARHIEIQLLADDHGNVVHLGERECSLQRRHQKVVEESPSAVVDPQLRARIGAAACELARAAGYRGAGTAEFLASAEDPSQFFFLEVNARLQVEHPVTEAVTGLDLVHEQLRIAAGEPLGFGQDDVVLRGHAIEARITAEDAAAGFLPATGPIVTYREPTGPGVRVDSGVAAGSLVTSFYDSLLAKVIAVGDDRTQALERLEAALSQLRILGVTTNAGFLRRLIGSPQMAAAEIDTRLIEREEIEVLATGAQRRAAAIATAAIETLALHEHADADPWSTLVGFRLEGPAPVQWELAAVGAGESMTVTVTGSPDEATVTALEATAVGANGAPQRHALAVAADGQRIRVVVDDVATMWDHARDGDVCWVATGADAFAFRVAETAVEGEDASAEGSLEAPMPGTVLAVRVSAGEPVAAGDVLVVMESMKMELSLVAPTDGTVADVHVGAGEGVRQGQALVELEAAG